LNVAFDTGESASGVDRVCLPGRESGLAVARAFGVSEYKSNKEIPVEPNPNPNPNPVIDQGAPYGCPARDRVTSNHIA